MKQDTRRLSAIASVSLCLLGFLGCADDEEAPGSLCDKADLGAACQCKVGDGVIACQNDVPVCECFAMPGESDDIDSTGDAGDSTGDGDRGDDGTGGLQGGGDGDGDAAGDGDGDAAGDGDGDAAGDGDGDAAGDGDGDSVPPGGPCASDGDCPSGQFCNVDACALTLCEPGLSACLDDNVTSCNSNGSAALPLDDGCPPPGLQCVDGSAAPTCKSGIDGEDGCSCTGGACTAELQCSGGLCLVAPIADWRFDGDALDASGNGYHANLDGIGYGSVDGSEGVRVQGEDGYVDVSAFASHFKSVISEFTTVMRLYRTDDASGGMQVLFALGNTGEEPEANSFRFHIDNGNLTMKTETGNGTNNDVSFVPAPATGAWVQVVHVVANDRVTVYVDGACAVRRQLVVAQTQATRMSIGGWPWEDISFDGYIDRVRVFDRALSGDGIAALEP